MDSKTRIGLALIVIAIFLGISGDSLLRTIPWGLNIFLWMASAVSITLLLLRHYRPEKLDGKIYSLAGALVFFSLMFVVRESPALMVLNLISMLTILTVLTLPAVGRQISKAGFFEFALGGMAAGFSATLLPPALAVLDVKWHSLPISGKMRYAISALRGLLIAAPIVMVFGGLFMAADAAFEGLVTETFKIDTEAVFLHALYTGVVTWFTAGYLRAFVLGVEPFGPIDTEHEEESSAKEKDHDTNFKSVTDQDAAVEEYGVPVGPYRSVTLHDSEEPSVKKEGAKKKVESGEKEKAKSEDPEDSGTATQKSEGFSAAKLPDFLTLGSVETGVIFGALNLLFLVFVIIQVPYLFGGMDLVQSTPDFKLAQYARRGFGELVVVAALVLPLLLVSHWLLRKKDIYAGKVFGVMSVIQIGLLFIVMASAVQRILLLSGNLGYGLTAVRLYPLFFIVFLALVFIWFGATVLRGFRKDFAWGTLWIGLSMVAVLHFINPDALIVKHNIELMKQGRTYDVYYNTNLSSDAHSALMEGLPYMEWHNRHRTLSILAEKLCESRPNSDIRTWNLSRQSLAGSEEVEGFIRTNGAPNCSID